MTRAPWRKKAHRGRGGDPLARPSDAAPYMAYPGIPKPPEAKTRRWKESRHLRYRQPCGYDPVSYMHILDALMNTNPNSEIRAKDMTDRMNAEYPALLWNATVVGTILSEFHEAFEDILGIKNGLLEKMRKGSTGYSYMLHVNPETASIAMKARDELLSIASKDIRQHDTGTKMPKWASLSTMMSERTVMLELTSLRPTL